MINKLILSEKPYQDKYGIFVRQINDENGNGVIGGTYDGDLSFESFEVLNLICAAPELLAALKDCQDALRIHAPDVWALTQASRAIDKAEGRSLS